MRKETGQQERSVDSAATGTAGKRPIGTLGIIIAEQPDM